MPEFIESLAEIKKACAICNYNVGELDERIKDAICQVCDKILDGKHHNQFICDPIQGGAGTPANEERCRELVEGSVGVITAICPTLGYAESADIAKTAIKTGESVREVLKNKDIMTEHEIDRLLDPKTMV